MIFSGQSKILKCVDCKKEYVHTTPTSILPLLFTIVISSIIYNEVINNYIETLLYSTVTSVISAIITYLAVFVSFEYVRSKHVQKCRKCGGKLEVSGGGFYDSGTPQLFEVIIYLITILIPILIIQTTH